MQINEPVQCTEGLWKYQSKQGGALQHYQLMIIKLVLKEGWNLLDRARVYVGQGLWSLQNDTLYFHDLSHLSEFSVKKKIREFLPALKLDNFVVSPQK